MKHKFLTALLALSATLCLTFGLAACGGDDGSSNGHIHTAKQYHSSADAHWKVCTTCGAQFAAGEHNFSASGVCTVCGYSSDFTEGLSYSVYSDTCTVTGIGEAGDVTDLVVPAYYNGRAVTAIASYAFETQSKLESVTIGRNVISIGDGAFSGCSGVVSIKIPDSVTEIGSGVFSGTAYYNNAANWDSDGMLYIGNHLFEARKTVSGDFTVKPGTKTIAGGAFAGCNDLTGIKFPAGVISIGNGAFRECGKLKSVTLRSDVSSIGEFAFEQCTALAEIRFDGSVYDWGYLQKYSGWDNLAGEYTVTCTNGTVDKSGYVTYFDDE